MTIKHDEKPGIFKFFVPMVSWWIADAFRPIRRVVGDEVVIKDDEVRIWKVGHASVLVNLYGTTILTDPLYVNWIPIPKRIVEPGIKFEDLPEAIDYVVISHAHLDHLNIKTLKRLAPKTGTLLLARGLSDLVEGMGYKRVEELYWDTTCYDGDLEFSAVESVHWGQRVPWEKQIRYYNATIIKKRGTTILFGGDSGYGPFFKELGKIHDIDLAILGIGSYYPKLLERNHKTPEQAVDAIQDLKAKHMIPMHYGNFRLSLEPIHEPPIRLTKEAQRQGILEKVHILDNGESYTLPKQTSTPIAMNNLEEIEVFVNIETKKPQQAVAV